MGFEQWQYEYLFLLHPEWEGPHKDILAAVEIMRGMDFESERAVAFREGWTRCREFVKRQVKQLVEDLAT